MLNDFCEFGKIARLSRECVVTEKIDGTNAQIYIAPRDIVMNTNLRPTDVVAWDRERDWAIFAGSRTRWITPQDDNHGFAKWVLAHASELVALGAGRHFGEWWGGGIQRGYGFKKGEKFFSLFNTSRWAGTHDVILTEKQDFVPECCRVVPVLYRGLFDTEKIQLVLDELGFSGSKAAPGFMRPEGVMVYHVAGNVYFKKTLEHDDEPKSKHAQ